MAGFFFSVEVFQKMLIMMLMLNFIFLEHLSIVSSVSIYIYSVFKILHQFLIVFVLIFDEPLAIFLYLSIFVVL